jgi:tetratricopeptide (TPR) repeat protein
VLEHDETIGFHLEHAHRNRLELGPLDPQGRALGERAARHLGAAGRRALARDELLPAASLLGRALDRLQADDPARGDLLIDWCEALLAAGEVGPAANAIAELERFTSDQRPATSDQRPASDRLRAWHTCFAGQLAVLTAPQALRASESAVAAAAETLVAAGDTAGEAKAHSVHALVLAQLGRIGGCEAALDKALAAARRAGERRRANAVLAGAPVAALWGPSPVTRASGRCLDVVRVLRITQGAPAVEAVALRCQAVLETLRGRGEAARRMIASSRSLVEELGITQHVLEADRFAGLIELLEGDAAAAERWLRRAWDGLRAEGLGIDAAQAGALLARALLAQSRSEEAEAVSRESEALAGDSFKAAIAWRGVRAEVLTARGDHASAIELARAAVEIAAATDDLLDHADARASLAVALRAAGRAAEADAEERHAIELWEAKGATLLVERMGRPQRARLAEEREPDRRLAPAPPAVGRRVRENAATAIWARLRAAALGRDIDTIAALCADELQVVHRPTAGLIDREGGLNRWRMLLQTEGLELSIEVLATLGDSLALVHDITAFDRLTQEGLSFGASRSSYLTLIETNQRGQALRVEVFADDRLGEALVRLYERHAERLPGGPERSRAAATARSVAVWNGPIEPARLATCMAASFQCVDHRSLGTWSARNPQEWLSHFRWQDDLTTSFGSRDEDVLALVPDAFLVRSVYFGTDRGGGVFENLLLVLCVFDADGLLARVEGFDPNHEREALARFEELVAQPPASRRVRPNRATGVAARVNDAVAARDIEALSSLHADGLRLVQHPTGVVFNREESLAWWRLFFADSHAAFRMHPFATLGDSLALTRYVWSGSAADNAAFPVGDFARDGLMLIEADGMGRATLMEEFAVDRLGDAIVRLYGWHAERLPEGPARTRTATIARVVSAQLGRLDLDRMAASMSADLELSDHRTVGVGAVHGADGFRAVLGALFETAADLANRVDDVVALRDDAFLMRVANSGTDRASGGTFERPFLLLGVFGEDGLFTRIDQFDVGQQAAALARFDELATAEPQSPGIERVATRAGHAELSADPLRIAPNAATRAGDRALQAIAARDRARLEDACAAPLVYEDRRRRVGTTGDRDQFIASCERIGSRGVRAARTVLAALGERFALVRVRWTTTPDGPDVEVEQLAVWEADGDGRLVTVVVFDPEDRRGAGEEMLERYYRSDAARCIPPAAAEAMRAINAHDLVRLRAALADDFVLSDHRRTGLGRLGIDHYLAAVAALFEQAPDAIFQPLYLVAVESHALLSMNRGSGTLAGGGGEFEQFYAFLSLHHGGRVVGLEFFEPEDLDRARARFAELRASAAS